MGLYLPLAALSELRLYLRHRELSERDLTESLPEVQDSSAEISNTVRRLAEHLLLLLQAAVSEGVLEPGLELPVRLQVEQAQEC